MEDTYIGAKKYTWKRSDSASLDISRYSNKKYVLVKKGFLGRIKAVIQPLDDYVEVVKYKTVKISLDKISENDILSLIKYFEEKRMIKQVELLKKEIEYRKRLLVNPDEIRPTELKNSLKIKYNIKKKVLKEKKYTAKKARLPKKDFLFLPTKNRMLFNYVNNKLGLSIKVIFNIINPNIYFKNLKKYEEENIFYENKLFEKIQKEIESLIDSYISNKKYIFSDKEDLLSDFELNNLLKIKCLEYGIEISSLPVVLTKEEKLKQLGLEQKDIEYAIAHNTPVESIVKNKQSEERKEERKKFIEQLRTLGISVHDDGTLIDSFAYQIASDCGVDCSKILNVFELDDSIITEICRVYTSPLKIR